MKKKKNYLPIISIFMCVIITSLFSYIFILGDYNINIKYQNVDSIYIVNDTSGTHKIENKYYIETITNKLKNIHAKKQIPLLNNANNASLTTYVFLLNNNTMYTISSSVSITTNLSNMKQKRQLIRANEKDFSDIYDYYLHIAKDNDVILDKVSI